MDDVGGIGKARVHTLSSPCIPRPKEKTDDTYIVCFNDCHHFNRNGYLSAQIDATSANLIRVVVVAQRYEF